MLGMEPKFAHKCFCASTAFIIRAETSNHDANNHMSGRNDFTAQYPYTSIMRTSFLCGLTLLISAAVANSEEWNPYSKHVKTASSEKPSVKTGDGSPPVNQPTPLWEFDQNRRFFETVINSGDSRASCPLHLKR